MAYLEDKSVDYFMDRMAKAGSNAAKQRVLDEWHRWAIDNGDEYEILYVMFRQALFNGECWKNDAMKWREAYMATQTARDIMAETIRVQSNAISTQSEAVKTYSEMVRDISVLFEERFGPLPWKKKTVVGFVGQEQDDSSSDASGG